MNTQHRQRSQKNEKKAQPKTAFICELHVEEIQSHDLFECMINMVR